MESRARLLNPGTSPQTRNPADTGLQVTTWAQHQTRRGRAGKGRLLLVGVQVDGIATVAVRRWEFGPAHGVEENGRRLTSSCRGPRSDLPFECDPDELIGTPPGHAERRLRGCHGLVDHALRSTPGVDAQAHRHHERPRPSVSKVLGGGHPDVPHSGLRGCVFVHGRISTGSRRLRDLAENTPSAGRLVASAPVA
jgi:hypothetical protein